MRKLIVFLLVFLIMVMPVNAQEYFIVRDLQAGDTFSYKNSITGEVVEYEVLGSEIPSSLMRYKLAQDTFEDWLANGNDSTLIGGFPLRQELQFPSAYDLSFELAGDHYNANYTFVSGLFLLSASEDREMSIDAFETPAVLLYNTTLELHHEINTRPFTPNSEYTDYLSYHLVTNQNITQDEEVYTWHDFNLTVVFQNDISISGQFNHPIYGNQRVNATQVYTFLSGSLYYNRSTCEVNSEGQDSCSVTNSLDRTDFTAYKGMINAIVSRSTGIPDLIEFEDQRGFDINTTLPALARFKLDQSWRDPVSFELVYTNIEPITFPISTWYTTINSTVITFIEDNLGNTTTIFLGLLPILTAIPVLVYKRRKK